MEIDGKCQPGMHNYVFDTCVKQEGFVWSYLYYHCTKCGDTFERKINSGS